MESIRNFFTRVPLSVFVAGAIFLGGLAATVAVIQNPLLQYQIRAACTCKERVHGTCVEVECDNGTITETFNREGDETTRTVEPSNSDSDASGTVNNPPDSDASGTVNNPSDNNTGQTDNQWTDNSQPSYGDAGETANETLSPENRPVPTWELRDNNNICPSGQKPCSYNRCRSLCGCGQTVSCVAKGADCPDNQCTSDAECGTSPTRRPLPTKSPDRELFPQPTQKRSRDDDDNDRPPVGRVLTPTPVPNPTARPTQPPETCPLPEAVNNLQVSCPRCE